tara:strand:- start:1539 stop:2348 length:810 start_codon:yes stop_codon:yes gene_type:complete
MALCYTNPMTHLSVNLNKVALLRNSRGKNHPAPEIFGEKILAWGAMGLTLHPRPDQRHAKYSDLPVLQGLVQNWKTKRPEVEFNVEGYPSEDFLEKVLSLKPDQCTLVPDPPEALTSDAGWDFQKHESFLKEVTVRLQEQGIRVSLFLDPFEFTPSQLEALRKISPERIEFYTEAFAENFGTEKQQTCLETYRKVAHQLTEVGIELNAGHDLNQKNLSLLIQAIPQIKEVSIGHALIEEALWEGFETTIKNYLKILSSCDLANPNEKSS